MEKSKIFSRGQVWYWVDPLFGKKGGSEKMPIGEGNFRYNRYVLIIQADDTIDGGSILVIPCSSVNNTPHDIQIPMSHVWHDGLSYAKCRNIMPVHPRMLDHYVCTLPKEIMDLIDAEIIKLLTPFIRNALRDDDIKDFFGIDMKVEQVHESPETERNLENHIREFATRHLQVTKKMGDVLTVKKLKNAYDEFCINNLIPVETDDLRFLDSFSRVTGPIIAGVSSWRDLDTQIVNDISFRGVITVGDTAPKIDIQEEPKPVEEKTTRKRGGSVTRRWTDENIIEFMDLFNRKGVEACMEKYGLTYNTARTYTNKWKNKIASIRQANTNDPLYRKPTATDITRSVSKVSNMIKTYLQSKDAYAMGKIEITKEEFYARLSSIVYYSLLDFLEIRVNGKKFYLPAKIGGTRDSMISWKFFDIAYHDQRVSRLKNLEELCSAIDKFYDPKNDVYGKIRINVEWLEVLNGRLEKIGMKPRHIKRINDALIDVVIHK